MHSQAPKAGGLSECGFCHAEDIARQQATDVARHQVVQPIPEDERGQEPGKPRRASLRCRC